ncbi:MAG: hypothetical protein COV69_04000 [Parcubacteria group bacterium CG11_big_fil_rev_8_21_14_0_20_39_14]|nr:MAG: hypothetical protein COV69_04000 [Parcubacteria group bacterium CG11_big_fil_rev_8_21_14_0_20_39_14]PIS35684.1 MAG: hypothetical protein COT36_01085 [Parcubacteria group bacterium CG08_land_8_20_14_0_20_38_56]
MAENYYQKLDIQPPNITSFMEEVLKKYELEKKQEELFNLATATQDPEKSGNLFSQLPSFKIIKIIEKLYQKEISEKALPEILEAELEIDHKTARGMAQDISMGGIEIYKARFEREAEKTEEEKVLEIPTVSSAKTTKPAQKISLKKPIAPLKKTEEIYPETSVPPGSADTYREMPPEEEYSSKF